MSFKVIFPHFLFLPEGGKDMRAHVCNTRIGPKLALDFFKTNAMVIYVEGILITLFISLKLRAESQLTMIPN